MINGGSRICSDLKAVAIYGYRLGHRRVTLDVRQSSVSAPSFTKINPKQVAFDFCGFLSRKRLNKAYLVLGIELLITKGV